MKRSLVLLVLAMTVMSVFAVAGCSASDETGTEQTENTVETDAENPEEESGNLLEGEIGALGRVSNAAKIAAESSEGRITSFDVAIISEEEFDADVGDNPYWDRSVFSDEDVDYYYSKVVFTWDDGEVKPPSYDVLWVEDGAWTSYREVVAPGGVVQPQ